MSKDEIGPCGVAWPIATLGEPAPEPTCEPTPAKQPVSGYPNRCGTCGQPAITDGTLHVWAGRWGLPEKPYDHPATPQEQ